MDTVEFKVPLELNSKLSLNSIYGGLHWAKRRKQAEGIHELVKSSLRAQRIPRKFFKNPVNMVFTWQSKLDLDNHGYIAKLIIDGLKGYLLYDDNKKYIRSIKHEYQTDEFAFGVLISISEDGKGENQ